MIAHYSDLGKTSRKSFKNTRLYNLRKMVLYFLVLNPGKFEFMKL